ncbi:MAG: glycyl-radical enzyme activating protein [Bacteroidales bacterium]|nr:glycyl-radical enzyme activating protein [Bacteroidales bacterium]
MNHQTDKGLIFDIKRFSVNDGPGIRTTIFFKGCPLSCWWCHNPEGISPETEEVFVTEKLDGKDFLRKKQVGTWFSVDELMKEIEKEQVFYETSAGGVTFSGGEPLLQYEFLLKLTDACTSKGIHTCLDTSGYVSPEIFKSVINSFDLFLYDIKTLDNEKHIKYTGFLADIILANLQTLADAGKQFIIRIPVIPGINDHEENITAVKDLISRLNNETKELHLLPYHAIAKGKYLRFGREFKMSGVNEPSENELLRLKSEFEETGYKVKIGG